MGEQSAASPDGGPDSCGWPGCNSDDDVRLCETADEQVWLCAECRGDVHNVSVVTHPGPDARSTTDASATAQEPATMAELRTESSKGDSSSEDVACADCGAYRELVGPISFDGVKTETGDMVCRVCAKRRGVKQAADTSEGECT